MNVLIFIVVAVIGAVVTTAVDMSIGMEFDDINLAILIIHKLQYLILGSILLSTMQYKFK